MPPSVARGRRWTNAFASRTVAAMTRLVIPIPNCDFDPSEVAVPWHVLKAAGHDIDFATPDGAPSHADELMISGLGLDWWGFVPGLRYFRLVGLALRANRPAREAYERLEADRAFLRPRRYEELRAGDYDALVLPGGHRARGMRAYLESAALRDFVGDFFDSGKPVGAICHGVQLAAHAISKRTGKSVLHGKKTTSLTWALERRAWTVGRIFRFWDPHYYRTYLERDGEAPGYRAVEMEVRRVLASSDDYLDVPDGDPDRARKRSGRYRDGPNDDRFAFVVRDGSYVSARWPGDAHTFARILAKVIAEAGAGTSSNTGPLAGDPRMTHAPRA
jgi:putative intracellular protease/amidase